MEALSITSIIIGIIASIITIIGGIISFVIYLRVSQERRKRKLIEGIIEAINGDKNVRSELKNLVRSLCKSDDDVKNDLKDWFILSVTEPEFVSRLYEINLFRNLENLRTDIRTITSPTRSDSSNPPPSPYFGSDSSNPPPASNIHVVTSQTDLSCNGTQKGESK